MELRNIFFILCFTSTFSAPNLAISLPKTEELTSSLAPLILPDAPASVAEQEISPYVAELITLAGEQPESLAGQYLDELHSAAILSKDPKEIRSSQEMMKDIARQLLTEIAVDTKAEPLLNIWSTTDPFIIEGPEPGIGLAKSDILAAEHMYELAADIDGAGPGVDAREQLLVLWEKHKTEPIDQLFLTRFNAWSAGVDTAWDELDTPAKQRAVQVSWDGWGENAPTDEDLKKLIMTDEVAWWVGGISLWVDDANIEKHADLVTLMVNGAFGGRELVLKTQQAFDAGLAGMQQIIETQAQFDTLYMLMDMNGFSN